MLAWKVEQCEKFQDKNCFYMYKCWGQENTDEQ